MAVVNPLVAPAAPAAPVSEPAKTPLIFKNEGERAAALSSVEKSADSLPKGMNPEQFQQSIKEKVQEIISAKIDAGGTGYTKPAEPPAAKPPEAPAAGPVAAPAEPAADTEKPWFGKLEGVDIPDFVKIPKTPEAAVKAHVDTQKHIKYLKDEVIPQLETYKDKAAKLEAEIADLKKMVAGKPMAEPPAPAPAAQTPQQRQSRLKDIRSLAEEIQKSPEEIKGTIGYYEKVERYNNLLAEEQEYNQAVIESMAKRLEDTEKRTLNFDEQAKKLREEEEARRKREEQEKAIEEGYKELDLFAGKHPEFKLEVETAHGKKEVTYKEMDAIYRKWGADVARVYYGENFNAQAPNAIDMIDEAVMNFMAGSNIALTQNCQARGITMPESLPQYMKLSELHCMYRGFKLDPVTKRWVPNTRKIGGSTERIVYPSLDAVLADMKMSNGDWYAEIAKAKNETAKAVVAALANATQVPTMPPTGGTDPSVASAPMTADEAYKIVIAGTERVDELVEKARRNPDDVEWKTFNQAMVTLGRKPLELPL